MSEEDHKLMASAAKEVPLSELLPEFQRLQCRLGEIEPDAKLKSRMRRLISGAIIFNDEPEIDEE